jgi:sulfur carrier protein
MKIVVNGETRQVEATRLTDLLRELGFGEAKVATAINEAFVPVARRSDTRLNDGDRLEVVAPMQGG